MSTPLSKLASFFGVEAPPSKNVPSLNEVIEKASKEYPFSGFAVPGIDSYKEAASFETTPAITSNRMKLTKNVSSRNIGRVSNCYTWTDKPSLTAEVPDYIQNAAVYLPEGLSIEDYNAMRKTAQEGVISGIGIPHEAAQSIALKLQGIIIEATLPYKAGALLQEGSDVEMHLIFQTGLNFAGLGGGGIPLTDHPAASGEIATYSENNAQAALLSALRNESDVLVFNLGIGSGFFGGAYGDLVKQSNVDGICKAVEKAGKQIQVIVPDVNFTHSQRQQLFRSGIQIAKADKDAVAALCAQKDLKVSCTIAGDPMSTLGIHGPGFWWETVGSPSDEERAAFLSPCYALGHIPIEVYQANQRHQKIAALSEFLIEPTQQVRDPSFEPKRSFPISFAAASIFLCITAAVLFKVYESAQNLEEQQRLLEEYCSAATEDTRSLLGSLFFDAPQSFKECLEQGIIPKS